jgi:hypothetical protein
MTAGNDYVTGTASPFGASTDWETTNLDTLTNGTGTPDPISSTLTGYIDALQTCRYNPSTDTNNCRDARL